MLLAESLLLALVLAENILLLIDELVVEPMRRTFWSRWFSSGQSTQSKKLYHMAPTWANLVKV